MVRLIKRMGVYSQNLPNAHLLQLISRYAVIWFKLTKISSSPTIERHLPMQTSNWTSVFEVVLGQLNGKNRLMAIAKLLVALCPNGLHVEKPSIFHVDTKEYETHSLYGSMLTNVLWKLHNMCHLCCLLTNIYACLWYFVHIVKSEVDMNWEIDTYESWENDERQFASNDWKLGWS